MPITRDPRVRHRPLRLLPLLGAVACAATLGGCDVGGRQPHATSKQETVTPATQQGQTTPHSASALGKSRDSALRIQDKTDDYNRRIEEAAEDVGKD